MRNNTQSRATHACGTLPHAMQPHSTQSRDTQSYDTWFAKLLLLTRICDMLRSYDARQYYKNVDLLLVIETQQSCLNRVRQVLLDANRNKMELMSMFFQIIDRNRFHR